MPRAYFHQVAAQHKKRYDKKEKTAQELVDAHPGHELSVKDETTVLCGLCSGLAIDVSKDGVKKVQQHCCGYVIASEKTATAEQKVLKLKPYSGGAAADASAQPTPQAKPAASVQLTMDESRRVGKLAELIIGICALIFAILNVPLEKLGKPAWRAFFMLINPFTGSYCRSFSRLGHIQTKDRLNMRDD
eukprot:gene48523-25842_t